MAVDAEDEADVAGSVPAVEVFGLGEVGVAPQGDLAGIRPGGTGRSALSK